MNLDRRTQVVFLTVLLSVMTYADRVIISIAGPGIMKEFSISAVKMGAVYSAYLLSYSIMMIPAGQVADKFGSKAALTLMAIGSALFTGLTALGGSPGLGTYIGILPSFLLIRLAMGIFAAPMYPAGARMNADWNPPSSHGRVWGWIASGAGIGGACTPILFVSLSARLGWRGVFLVTAAGSAILAAVWYYVVPNHPPGTMLSNTGKSPRIATPWRALLANRDLMLLTASYAIVNYFEYIFFFWLYYYFGQVRKMSLDRSAVYTTLMWIAWIVMTPIGGWVSDRCVMKFGLQVGRRFVPLVGLVLSAVLVCVGSKVTDTLPTVVLLCLSLGLAASTDGPYWAAAIEASGEHSGTGSAIFNTGGNLGGLLAPVATPLIASYFGWTWGLYTGGILVIFAATAWVFIGAGTVELQTAKLG